MKYTLDHYYMQNMYLKFKYTISSTNTIENKYVLLKNRKQNKKKRKSLYLLSIPSSVEATYDTLRAGRSL